MIKKLNNKTRLGIPIFLIVTLLSSTIFSRKETLAIEDEDIQLMNVNGTEDIYTNFDEDVLGIEITTDVVNGEVETISIDIGSATLDTDISSVPGLRLSNNILTFGSDINQNVSYIITGTTTSRMIEIANGVSVTIIFDGLNITTDRSPVRVLGTANILLRNISTLQCTSTNQVTGGVIAAGIYVANTGSLILDSNEDGELSASGGRLAAGIGGTHNLNVGTILIKGGNINATGGWYGAGIGSGAIYRANIHISNINIHISGGNVTAEGGFLGGAGIGTGSFVSSNNSTKSNINILISDNAVVTANSVSSSSAIGSGDYTVANNSLIQNMNIDITNNVVVQANGNSGGPGIGIGAVAISNRIEDIGINISDNARVMANGGGTSSGIGTGIIGSDTTIHNMHINISGGNITATRGTSVGGSGPALHDIGLGSTSANASIDLQVHIIGGSILPTRGSIYNPTNGDFGAPDILSMFTLSGYSPGEPFSIVATGTQGSYTYEGIAHDDGYAYIWLSFLGSIETLTPTNLTEATAASVKAPDEMISSYIPGQVTLQGSYLLNTLSIDMTSAYFEWGRTTDYGEQVSIIDQIQTTTLGVYDVNHQLSVDPGNYHYRLVIELGGIKMYGEDKQFSIANLSPSLDVVGQYTTGTQANIQGIYDVNGHSLQSGHFEFSLDGSNWFTLTNTSSPVSILSGIGIDMTSGQIDSNIQTPSMIVTGIPYNSTLYYRMIITSEVGSESVEGSLSMPLSITIEYVDMNLNPIHPSEVQGVNQGESYYIEAEEIEGFTNVGVIVDGGQRDVSRSYYENLSVTQAHTVQFVYDDTNTMLSLSVPAKMVFAAFASEGGTVTAPEYEVTNLSSLPVEVSLTSFEETDLDGLMVVQRPPQNNNEIQLHLLGQKNFNTIPNLPIGEIGNDGFLGRLAHRNEPASSGTFTFRGNYQGSFAMPREPRFQAVFRFELVLPERP